MGKAPLSRPLREIKQLLCVHSLILYYIKQIDSMLPCICQIIDHRGRQNVVRTSVTHSAIASCATFLFLPHFDVICDLLLDRCTATWNLFVKSLSYVKTATAMFCYLQNEHTLPPKSASKSCPYKSGELQFETFAGPECETKQSLRPALFNLQTDLHI